MDQKGCMKCGQRDVSTKEIGIPGGGFSHSYVVDIPHNSFHVVTCRNCGYSEFYNTEAVDDSRAVEYFFGE
ncbi:zinc ribbon domain-containing protein [Planococcus sp. N028]|uniref:Zinc ribbon domain-containing protein n=1 Tax=Planococcus shixiaomingii TaxID=3058393 RepID=A0ABT8N393_9BACL|nr:MULTISPECIES: zinc ribbon domain-containing protein [unclassified Planococcus (in: firmicutes)]MDN7242356.1 zinc ribbon domain-containing protein [Planococcus sp. N028]WKA54597.1 zinc ribbon domain-containing protein [Planococcus sp. N022]